ncbi:adhesive plaque matrix protein isoform X2 [Tribolium madens]|uniref:adhesive plaque matrix protein isoform X2 n=1 Tax=Tribolium madens TaxID=41895 RepID=UPI001CF74FC3|nr:adhesive plaque matrix protein isoform X2 [Tribolium madens]
MRFYLLAAAAFTVASAQQYTTPVPILKQINKHNEDGSYSYGYEAADGTYKIETKYPDGQVFGKYGYVDDQGKLRTVEYGASRRGFEPAGNEIQVPPPTLKINNDYAKPLGSNEEDDGQYREDPSVYYKNEPYAQTQPRPPTAYRPQPAYQPTYQPSFRPQTSFNNFPRQPNYYNPAPPAYPNYHPFQGHPATNVDLNSGSYTVNYRR